MNNIGRQGTIFRKTFSGRINMLHRLSEKGYSWFTIGSEYKNGTVLPNAPKFVIGDVIFLVLVPFRQYFLLLHPQENESIHMVSSLEVSVVEVFPHFSGLQEFQEWYYGLREKELVEIGTLFASTFLYDVYEQELSNGTFCPIDNEK
jgi:hypothetical protein